MAQKNVSKFSQVIILAAANGINFLINFATNPFLARKLSYKENGTLGQLYLLSNYFLLIFGLGIASVANLFLAENKDSEGKVLYNFTYVLLISSLFSIACIALLSPLIDTTFSNAGLSKYVIQYIPSIISVIVGSCQTYFMVYLAKTRELAIITVVTNIIRIAGIFIGVNHYHSLTWIINFLNLYNVLVLVLGLLVLYKSFGKFQKPDFRFILKVLKISYPFLLLGIVGYGMVYADGLLISNMLDPKAFAIYRNGAIEIPFLSTVYLSINAVAIPHLYKLLNNNQVEQVFAWKRKIATANAFVLFPICIFLVINSNSFIGTYLSNKYIDSAIIFSIYNLTTLMRITDYQDLLTMRKRGQIIFYWTLTCFIVNVVLNIAFIKIWGINGSAIAYFVSTLILGIGLIYSTCRVYNMSIRKYFDIKNILLIFGLSVFFSCVSKIVITGTVVNFLCIAGLYGVIIYIIMVRWFKFIDLELLPSKIRKMFSMLAK